MLGDAVELTPGYRTWWSYIPHFIGSPGYVYAYAYGQLLALAVYARYEAEGAAFVPAYLDLLRAGGSMAPEALGPHRRRRPRRPGVLGRRAGHHRRASSRPPRPRPARPAASELASTCSPAPEADLPGSRRVPPPVRVGRCGLRWISGFGTEFCLRCGGSTGGGSWLAWRQSSPRGRMAKRHGVEPRSDRPGALPPRVPASTTLGRPARRAGVVAPAHPRGGAAALRPASTSWPATTSCSEVSRDPQRFGARQGSALRDVARSPSRGRPSPAPTRRCRAGSVAW